MKDRTAQDRNSQGCECSIAMIISCECSHRARHRQRARFVRLAVGAGWRWGQIESAIQGWHENLLRLGLSKRVKRNPTGELRKALRDAGRLRHTYQVQRFCGPGRDQIVHRGLTEREGLRVVELAAAANVGRRYDFASGTFDLLTLYKSLRFSQWSGVNGSMPVSINLLRGPLAISWRHSKIYLKVWKKLGLLRLRRRANRQKHLCRIFAVNFKFESPFAGNPPRRIAYLDEYDSLDELVHHLIESKKSSVRGIIKQLGHSRKLRKCDVAKRCGKALKKGGYS